MEEQIYTGLERHGFCCRPDALKMAPKALGETIREFISQ